jgi:hypothetical protein
MSFKHGVVAFIKWHRFFLNNKTPGQIKSAKMKKLLFVGVLLINVSVNSQEPVKSGSTGFDILRDSIAHGKIDTIIYKSKPVDTLRRRVIYTTPGYSKKNKYPCCIFSELPVLFGYTFKTRSCIIFCSLMTMGKFI